MMSTKNVKFLSHVVLTSSDFRFIVTEQLQDLGLNPENILIEPEAKNTAPAICSLFVGAK